MIHTAVDTARRVCIQSAVGAAADALLRGNDLLPHLDDHERLSRLMAALGAVADTLVSNAGLCLPDALIALQAEALTFSEALMREEANDLVRRCDSCAESGPLTYSPEHEARFCGR